MKRNLALVLAVLMLFSINVGLAAAQDNTTVTVWCWDPAFNVFAMREAAKIYNEINPNVTIEVVEVPWADIQTRLTTAVMAGQMDSMPDILLMQDNAMQQNVTNYPGIFADLTDSGINFADFADYKIALTSVDGRNYAVPFDNGTTINALRLDVLEKAGYTLDDFTDITWSQYIELGKDILEQTGMPLVSNVAASPDHLMLTLQSAGVWMFDEEGAPFFTENEVLVETIGVYVEMMQSGVGIQVNDWEQYISSLNRGTVAGTINGCWIIGSISAQEDQAGLWGITNIPRLDHAPNATNYSNQGGSSWMVLESSANKEAAIDFLKHTFAGSVELYETILPPSGALATYLPAGESDVYSMPIEFFGGQTIYADITAFAAKVPQVQYGVYNYEARDALAVAIAQVFQGQSIHNALREAEDTVRFLMGP